jgi:hypothetical protein
MDTRPPRHDETPAALLEESPRSDDWARRMFAGAASGGRTLSSLTMEFGLANPRSGDFSMPVRRGYGAPRRVFRRPNETGSFRVPVGSKVPMAGTWHPSGGRDGHLAVIDADGTEWDFWRLSTPWDQTTQRTQLQALGDAANWQAGFSMAYDLVAATVLHVADPDGHAVQVDTYRGNGATFIRSPLSRNVATPAEVAAGRIGHALRLGAVCPLTGPAAPASIIDPDDPDVGHRFGLAALPCAVHEGVDGRRPLDAAVYHGCRQHLRPEIVDDAYIEAWLDRRGYTGLQRNVARVFATCLVEFGWEFLITSAGPAYVQADGSDPQAWRRLGVTGDGRDLLAGLITSAEQIRTVRSPVAHGTRRAHHTADMAYPTAA